MSEVSNGLIFASLKRDFKYRRHVYFEPIWPHVIYQAIAYLKSHNKFYEDISIAKSLLNEKIFRFSSIVEIQRKNKSVTEKLISDGKEMRKRLIQNMLQLTIP